MAVYLVEYHNSKKLITFHEGETTLEEQVKKSFMIRSKVIIQCYNKEWEEYIDLDTGVIPETKSKLRLIDIDVAAISQTDSDDVPVSSLPSTSAGPTSTTEVTSPTKALRKEKWPGTNFVIPKFKPDIDVYLNRENGKGIDKGACLPRNVLEHILSRVGEEIYRYTVRPDKEQRDVVASKLVRKHPCLKIPGTAGGFEGWSKRLFTYMTHLREKLRTDVEELAGTSGRRSRLNPQGLPAKSGITKAGKRGAVNDRPNFPKDITEADIEQLREQLITLYETGHQQSDDAQRMMSLTFAQRRAEIKKQPPVKVIDFLKRWPMLRNGSQVLREFSRITSTVPDIKSYLANNSGKMITLFSTRSGKRRDKIQDIITLCEECCKECCEAPSRIQELKDLSVLQCLPHYFSEDPDGFHRMIKEGGANVSSSGEDGIEIDMQGVGVIVLHVVDDDSSHMDYAVAAEQNILLDEIATFTEAVQLAFCLHYILDLQYSRSARNTWTFLQKVVMEIDSVKLPNAVASLKSKILSTD